jgi:hypothetical protein
VRHAGLGVAALLGSLVPAVWILVLFAVAGTTTNTDLADGLIVASFIALPIIAIVVLVLAIAALIVNNPLGKVLASIALALVIGECVLLGLAATVVVF